MAVVYAQEFVASFFGEKLCVAHSQHSQLSGKGLGSFWDGAGRSPGHLARVVPSNVLLHLDFGVKILDIPTQA